MSLTEEFDAIRANPIIYCDSSFQKTGYSSQVFCDRCGLSGLKVYVSSAKTPTIDLCPTCFNALGKTGNVVGLSQIDEADDDEDDDNDVGPPQNFQQHSCKAVRPSSMR